MKDYHTEVLLAVCRCAGITRRMLVSKSRKKKLAYARHISAYHLYNSGFYSLEGVALVLGRTNHATAYNSVRKYSSLNKYDEVFQSLSERVETELKTLKIAA